MKPEKVKLEPELLTINQACQLLNIARCTLRMRVASGEIAVQPIYIGRKKLFPRRELEAYIRAGLPAKNVWNEMRKTILKGT